MKRVHSLLLLLLSLCSILAHHSVYAWGKSNNDETEVDTGDDDATTTTEEDTATASLESSSVEVEEEKDGDEEEEADDLVEENPDYDPNAASDDDDDDDDDDEDDSSAMADMVSPKEKIALALRKTRRTSKKTIKFIKKHRSEITLGLTVFAFRREIRDGLIHILKTTFVDPNSGKITLARVHPTTVLKLLLFVDFMRRLQGKSRAGATDDEARNAIALFGRTNPVLATVFHKLLHVPMYNPAFVPPVAQHYTFERINERYVKDGLALHKALHSTQDGSLKWPSSDFAMSQPLSKGANVTACSTNDTVIILDFTKLDQTVSNMNEVRDQVSFLLSQYQSVATSVGKTTMAATVTPDSKNASSTSEDNEDEEEVEIKPIEVICLVESPGGSAADYGLAAQQLLRLRNAPGIKLTICVDKVAASGGYMVACTAEKLLAAPFAVVGSIGVLGQIVNVQKLLEGWGLDPLVFRGGKDKAPLGVIGEVTSDGKAKVQSMIDDTHRAFQKHVAAARPKIKMSKVGNGDVWLGQDALQLGLIDRIATSDEYIGERIASGARVLRMIKCHRMRFPFVGRHREVTSISAQERCLPSLGTSFTNAAGNVLKRASDYLLTSSQGNSDPRLVASLVDSPKFGM